MYFQFSIGRLDLCQIARAGTFQVVDGIDGLKLIHHGASLLAGIAIKQANAMTQLVGHLFSKCRETGNDRIDHDRSVIDDLSVLEADRVQFDGVSRVVKDFSTLNGETVNAEHRLQRGALILKSKSRAALFVSCIPGLQGRKQVRNLSRSKVGNADVNLDVSALRPGPKSDRRSAHSNFARNGSLGLGRRGDPAACQQ